MLVAFAVQIPNSSDRALGDLVPNSSDRAIEPELVEEVDVQPVNEGDEYPLVLHPGTTLTTGFPFVAAVQEATLAGWVDISYSLGLETNVYVLKTKVDFARLAP